MSSFRDLKNASGRDSKNVRDFASSDIWMSLADQSQPCGLPNPNPAVSLWNHIYIDLIFIFIWICTKLHRLIIPLNMPEDFHQDPLGLGFRVNQQTSNCICFWKKPVDKISQCSLALTPPPLCFRMPLPAALLARLAKRGIVRQSDQGTRKPLLALQSFLFLRFIHFCVL